MGLFFGVVVGLVVNPYGVNRHSIHDGKRTKSCSSYQFYNFSTRPDGMNCFRWISLFVLYSHRRASFRRERFFSFIRFCPALPLFRWGSVARRFKTVVWLSAVWAIRVNRSWSATAVAWNNDLRILVDENRYQISAQILSLKFMMQQACAWYGHKNAERHRARLLTVR